MCGVAIRRWNDEAPCPRFHIYQVNGASLQTYLGTDLFIIGSCTKKHPLTIKESFLLTPALSDLLAT
jgi:hypothetical protein